jgi:hypothetical protein
VVASTTTGPEATGPTTTGPEATGPTTTGPEATGPTTTGPEATGPTTTGPDTTVIDDPAATPSSATTATTATAATTATTTTTASPSTAIGVGPAGTFTVLSPIGRVVDPTRDGRVITYQVFAPAGSTAAAPVIVVSHGGAGNPRGHLSGNHLGETFASGGFIAVHLAHDESTDGNRQVEDRPADVSFFLDELEAGRVALPEGFTGSVDIERIGHTGHSFGAYTSHAVGGATYLAPSGGTQTFGDERIDALAPISPQGPDQFGGFVNGPADSTWSTVTIPVFDLIGGDEVDDNAVDTIQRPGWRLAPFDHYPGSSDTFRTIVAGAVHSDMWRTGADDVERFVATEILDFMRRYVAGDETVDVCGIGVADGNDELVTTSATIERRAADPAGPLAACS